MLNLQQVVLIILKSLDEIDVVIIDNNTMKPFELTGIEIIFMFHAYDFEEEISRVKGINTKINFISFYYIWKWHWNLVN